MKHEDSQFFECDWLKQQSFVFSGRFKYQWFHACEMRKKAVFAFDVSRRFFFFAFSAKQNHWSYFTQHNLQGLLQPDWSPLSLFFCFDVQQTAKEQKNAKSYCVLCTVKTITSELSSELCQVIHYDLSNCSIATAHTRLPGTAMILWNTAVDDAQIVSASSRMANKTTKNVFECEIEIKLTFNSKPKNRNISGLVQNFQSSHAVFFRRRQRNLTRVIKHVHSYFPAHLSFCFLNNVCFPQWLANVPHWIALAELKKH